MVKGFVTIATGDEQYYILARNLLLFYRMNLFYFKCIIEDKVNSINLWVKWLRERVQDKLKNVGGKNI